MIGRSFTSEAVILSRRNFAEGDRILSVYSKKYGKISLLAKGIRKPKSRKRGHLEIFTQFNFSASNSKGIPIITEAVLVNNFPLIRKNLKKASVSYFMVEVISRITEEGEPNVNLYDILVSYLSKIEKEGNLKKNRLEYVTKVVTVLGFWPVGKKLNDPDSFIESVTERKMTSSQIAKKILRN